VQPALGRVFESSEETPGSDKVVILSYGVWQKYFGGDSKVLGNAVTLDDASYTVVGVMPRDFNYPDAHTEFWTPLALPVPHILGLQVLARLKDDVSIGAASEEASAIAREFRGESPGGPSGPPRIQLLTKKDELVAPIRLPLFVFSIAVSFVLLVA